MKRDIVVAARWTRRWQVPLGLLLVRAGMRLAMRPRLEVTVDGKPWRTYAPSLDVDVDLVEVDATPPKFAQGGIVKEPALIRFGDGGPEHVIPTKASS